MNKRNIIIFLSRLAISITCGYKYIETKDIKAVVLYGLGWWVFLIIWEKLIEKHKK